MSTIQLLPGERLLRQNRGVSLTSHRVHFEQETWGAKKLTTIMLEDLTSCNIETRSKPGWLVAGGVAGGYMALWAVSSGDPGKFVAGVLLAALCLVAYVLTRRKIMVLRSASEGIELNVSGDSWDSLKAFVDAVQTAKHERLMLLAQDRGQERR